MAKEKRKKLSKKIIALIVCGVFVGLILLSVFAIQIGMWVSDGIQCWRPSYQQLSEAEMRVILDRMAPLEEDDRSDEDYAVLFKQTGLTKIGIDDALDKEHGESGIKRILEIQKNYFEPHTVTNKGFAPWCCTDFIEKHVEHAYLKDGDIIVTSSTHFSSCRIGHAGLVVNASTGTVIQANSYSQPSRLANISLYTNRVNFMILRPIADDETKEKVVNYALDNLLGIRYDFAVGVTSDKNSIATTQCAHLVWSAYNHFGIDLDANGGKVVSPWDLANTKNAELVQTFGFDPDKGWDKLNY